VLHGLIWAVVLVLRCRFLGGEENSQLALLTGAALGLPTLAQVALCARAERRCADCGQA